MRLKECKAQVQLILPPDLVEKAREYGLNISNISENALRSYIERLEEPKQNTERKYTFLGEASSNE